MSFWMTEANNIQWKRLSTEAAVIVASILLAFGIDAWWEGRQDRQLEQSILSSLLDEFRGIEKMFGHERRTQQGILDATQRLLRATLDSDFELERGAIDRNLADIGWASDATDWNTAVLDGLISGGDISLVSNTDLRRVLAIWPARIERIKLYYREDSAYFFSTLGPFLNMNAYMPPVANAGQFEPGHPENEVYVSRYSHSADYDNSTLLSDRVFQNILIDKVYRQENILGIAFSGLDEHLDSTIQLLQEELSE
jgi:hypothetical protein